MVLKKTMLQTFDKYIFGFYKQVKRGRDVPLMKLMQPFAAVGVSADAISLFGLISGIISAVYLQYSKAGFLFFWVLKRVTDIVDGPLARISSKELFPNVNMDHISDLTFSVVLLAATIPIVGPYLPMIAIVTHVIHIITDTQGIGNSLFGPSNWAQFFFLIDLFSAGLIFQICFTILALSIRVVYRKILLSRS